MYTIYTCLINIKALRNRFDCSRLFETKKSLRFTLVRSQRTSHRIDRILKKLSGIYEL